MSSYTIVTVCEYPPIPTRIMDWRANYADQDECGPYGWGDTEEAAIVDLVVNYALPQESK